MTALRSLQFNTEDQVIAEIAGLRRGYRQTGQWNLEQICWHLDQAIQSRMKPGPVVPNTPEQDARKSTLLQVLETGTLPKGLNAPDHFIPPADAGEGAIDAVLVTLDQFKNYTGVIATHRLFGQLSDADARTLNLIHCAHHLSHLVPTTGTSS